MKITFHKHEGTLKQFSILDEWGKVNGTLQRVTTSAGVRWRLSWRGNPAGIFQTEKQATDAALIIASETPCPKCFLGQCTNECRR